jgi:glutathione S-transferase
MGSLVDTDIGLRSQLGKSPILTTKDGRVIVETAAIISYLLVTYDPTKKFAPADPLHDEELASFASSSLGPVALVELFFEILAKMTPWPIVYISRAIHSQIQKTFTTGEFKKNLTFLEDELGEKEWFNGEHLGRSDIMISFPLDNIAQRGWVNFDKDYPKLAAWRKRQTERDAWKRGIEKGNGYDLSVP